MTAAAMNPVDCERLIRGARRAVVDGHAKGVIEPLTRAIAQWPSDRRLYEVLATALDDQARYEAAASVLLEGSANADLPPAQLRRAFSLAKRGNSPSLMQQACRTALSRHPGTEWPVEPLLRLTERAGDNAAIVDLASASLRLRAEDRLICTAIRFTELKRPGLWVGMAKRLAADFPTCSS